MSGIAVPAWIVGLWNQAQAAVTSMLDQLAKLSTEDPRYLVMFATIFIGVVFVLPLMWHLFDRFTRWIFP